MPATWKLTTTVLLTAAFSILILLHTPGIDGPWYSHAGWHHAPALEIWTMMLLCALPMGAAIFLHDRFKRTRIALALIMFSVVGFTLTSVTHLANQFSWQPMVRSIQNPVSISYFADAAILMNAPGTVGDWLRQYPQLSPQMFLHSQNKPPGPVLYYALFIHFFGVTDRAALLAGMALACIISLAVPATHWLARVLGASTSSAFYAAVALALTPSLNLFFPSFDAAYMIATCGLLGLWALAMKHDRAAASLAFGAVLALATFIAYHLLALGALIVALGWTLPPPARRIRTFVNHSGIALATFIGLYFVFWLFVGFNPIATVSIAMQNAAHLASNWYRPYPWTILFDLTGILLGAGWIGALLAVFYLFNGEDLRRDVVRLGLLQVVLVPVTGLLPGETERVCAFLIPLLAIPAGAELARWKPLPRYAALACTFIILVLLAQNLTQTYGTKAPLVMPR